MILQPDMMSPTQKPNDVAYKSYPRRMLAVGVMNYLFANRVAYGGQRRTFDNAVYNLAACFKVPNDQVALLSDRGPQTYPPTKAIIQDRFRVSWRPVGRWTTWS